MMYVPWVEALIGMSRTPVSRRRTFDMAARPSRFAFVALGMLGALHLAADPAQAQGNASNNTFTTSTSSTEVLHDSFATERLDTYLTQIIGRVAGGGTVFDQSYAFQFGSSEVTAGVTDAYSALASYFGASPYNTYGPTLLSSTTSLVSTVTGAPQETRRTSTETVIAEEFVGPFSFLIGDLGRCISFSAQVTWTTLGHRVGCDGAGTLFEVVVGTIDINANVNTQFDVFRTITTTDTYQTIERYEIVATAGPITTVPEPSTWALSGVGLIALAWSVRRRRTRGLAMCVASLSALFLAADSAQAQTTNQTITTSTSSTEVLFDSFVTQRFDTYLTQIIGRVAGGPTLFDQSYTFAFGTSEVSAGVGSAQSALANFFGVLPYTLLGPTLASSQQIVVGSVTSDPEITARVAGVQTVTLEDLIGPATAITGNRDLGGVPFFVESGTTNLNVNTNIQFDVFRTITTTDTYQTIERYELVATAGPIATVPEPSTWMLTAVGLLALAWQTRRRSVMPRS